MNTENYEHLVLGNGNPNHPENQEQVLEMTPEEAFDNYASENEIPNEVSEFIEFLGRKLKSKNDALKQLHDSMGDTAPAHYKNSIWKIFKM